MPARTILLVDDSDGVRLTMSALLEDLGHHVIEAATLAEARARLAAARFDAAVVDLHLPDGRGTSLLAELRDGAPATARILLTGDDSSDPLDAVDLRAPKGVDAGELATMIERVLAARG